MQDPGLSQILHTSRQAVPCGFICFRDFAFWGVLHVVAQRSDSGDVLRRSATSLNLDCRWWEYLWLASTTGLMSNSSQRLIAWAQNLHFQDV